MSNICKSCEEEIKPDEWSDEEKKICIDCQDYEDKEYNEDYAQRKAH